MLQIDPNGHANYNDNIREVGCYPWDVCAGIIIAQEAGALVSGSHDVFAKLSSSPGFTGDVTSEILLGRKYIVVRGMAGLTDKVCFSSSIHLTITDLKGFKESTLEAQKRIINEYYSTVENYTVKGLGTQE